ncbi:uncharacterized protein AMSG_10119 [Thecamonas trahens ATCC 50062]|uniref:Uncharacterized protein n=1 Tax=Thecamonas trahens ATCC 50062 TaxID=461836 RepID=A0A0L0DQ17_THETB|nr:hypothetical protein AMSG_10119 [Thecamonas trahens ATCC 50062]KNC54397.1 hypothetical protein AMSG_10119 [Thecamonas trahens ATCC 50062]|eukprot:XP_013753695.1 hypothetical protein AMSG_10119 [Thecamonas trahens ATCC 50062]
MAFAELEAVLGWPRGPFVEPTVVAVVGEAAASAFDPALVVVEGLDALVYGVGYDDAEVLGLFARLHEWSAGDDGGRGGRARCLVVTATSGTATLAMDLAVLRSDYVLTVAPLATGYSREVHGSIAVAAAPEASGVVGRVVHYKAADGASRFFLKGR